MPLLLPTQHIVWFALCTNSDLRRSSLQFTEVAISPLFICRLIADMPKSRSPKPPLLNPTHPHTRPGRVNFDARGNAIYEWNGDLLNLSGSQGKRLRERALRNPALAIINETPSELIQPANTQGLRIGYNPYNSGELVQTSDTTQAARKRVNLRELSEWIKLKRRLDTKNP